MRGIEKCGEFIAGNVPLCHPKTGEKIYLWCWEGGKPKDFLFSLVPCPDRKKAIFQKETDQQGFNILQFIVHPDVYTELHNKLWRPWKWVVYHDDSPCSGTDAVRLVGGYCPSCKIHPDTQSTCLKSHCPDCDEPLEHGKDRCKDYICPSCCFKFRTPAPIR